MLKFYELLELRAHAHFLNTPLVLLPIWSGGRLNINMSPNQYRDPHVKDKTVSRPSYL